jgi:branched-chain amino acid transport system substrate-binding protein
MPTGFHALRAAAAAAVLAAVAGLAACGGSEQPNPAKAKFDLTVGNLVPLRGDLAEYGPSGRKSAKLAGNEENNASSKAGAPITVKTEIADSETQTIAASIAARELIGEGATCLAGDWSSASTISVGNQVAAREGVPLISPASTNFGITELDDRGYVFRTAPSDSLQVIALADLVEKAVGAAEGKMVSLAGRRDAYGTQFTERFADLWRQRGGKVSGPVLYDPTKGSFDDDAKRIVSGEPDVFVVADFPQTYARLAPSLLDTGKFDAGKLFAPDTMLVDSSAEWGIPEDALDGAQVTRPGSSAPDAAGRSFEKLFSGSPLPPPVPQAFAAQNFDANVLCFLAAVAAGSPKPGAIKDEIASVSGPPGPRLDFRKLGEAVKELREGHDVDYEGASGPLNLDVHGDPSAAYYDTLTYSGGRPEASGRVLAQSGG